MASHQARSQSHKMIKTITTMKPMVSKAFHGSTRQAVAAGSGDVQIKPRKARCIAS
jgi:hypothetical protein